MNAEFWEASKFNQVWIEEGFKQVLEGFDNGFP